MRGDIRSHGLWERTAPPAPVTAPLSSDREVDVAIIGAGYTGCSAALHLAEGGATVAVLEGSEVGFGGSGRNVGLVNAGMWVMPDDVPAKLGDEHGERLLSLLGQGPRAVFDLIERHSIDCEMLRNGTLHCAVGSKGLENISERARQWEALGAPVRLLDAEETAAKVGTRAYSGALLDERAGTIQPLAYARGLARAVCAAGVALYTSSPVGDVVDEGSTWLLKTPGGTVRSRWVIVATNAYTNDVWPQISAEMVRVPYFNLATRPLSDNLRRSILPERHGVWDTCQMLSSLRFDREHRLIFGSIGALRGTGSPVHRNWGRRALTQLFPQLEGITFETEWYGQIGMTNNSLPRYHRLARNVVSFSGYNGRGIATGTVFGRCLAEMILGKIDERDLPLPKSLPVAERGKAAKEAFYELGSQVAHFGAARF